MADFDTAFSAVLKAEGGYRLVDDPDDPGGRTFAGISERWHPDWPGWAILDSPARRGELFLSVRVMAAVKELYREKYWDPIGGDRISDQAHATALYSTAVLSGVGTARRFRDDLRDSPDFGAGLALLRIARYCRLVQRNPKLGKYLRGWTERALQDCARGNE